MDIPETNDISFDLPKNRSNVIKVLGVGGGGSNAINYMFEQGIKGVDFVVSNTDAQALTESPVPIKIQLGASLTEGLGAGANPDVGALAAEESAQAIQDVLTTQTKMIFITAGMGGGTGTGAAPVIAAMSKALDILTVGIVTMPFSFEGKLRLDQAQKGLEKLKANVDALIVINNNKLREVYGNLGFKAGFAKADEVLATAARGIAEVITHHYTQNIDLKDAKTVLTNSGTAIMGSGTASGSNRAQEAISSALDSPLLNDNKITGCKNVLLLIVSGSDEITIDEIGEINDFIQTEAGNQTNIIMGVGEDPQLGNEVSVTVIATGFGMEQQHEISNTEAKKIIHNLEEEQKMEQNFDAAEKASNTSAAPKNAFDEPVLKTSESSFPDNDAPILTPAEQHALIMNMEVIYDIVTPPQQPTAVDLTQETDVLDFNLNFSESTEEEIVFKTPNEAFNTFDEQNEMNNDTEATISTFETTEEKFLVAEQPFAVQDVWEEEAEEATESSPMEAAFVEEINSLMFNLEEESPTLEVTPSEPLSQTERLEETHTNLEESIDLETFFTSETTVEEQEEAFIFNEISAEISAMEVVDPEYLTAEEKQIQMDFEIPIQKTAPTIIDDSIEVSENNEVRFALEDVTDEQEDNSLQTHLEEAGHEIAFELKEVEAPVAATEEVEEESSKRTPLAESEEEENPFDQSIQATLQSQNQKRRSYLKEFNHKFTAHQLQRVDDMEKIPAYKRQGLDLEEDQRNSPSRTSLSNDANDDIQLRSNNSFLHDNVD